MAGIININNAYNGNTKRVVSKLSFEVGQVFKAKIISTGELNNELILKMLDGWKFSAKLQTPLDFTPKGMVKFVVEGFEDGKLQLKVISDSKDKEEDSYGDSLEDVVREQKLSGGKEDQELLKKMIKHDMPLNKENIAKVKTLLDFKNKMSSGEEEQDNFIAKYIESKNISQDSTEAQKIKDALKGFLKQLNSSSLDEILTLYENGIDITEDNLRAFNNVFKEQSTIYKDIKSVNAELLNGDTKAEESLNNIAFKSVAENDLSIFKESRESNKGAGGVSEAHKFNGAKSNGNESVVSQGDTKAEESLRNIAAKNAAENDFGILKDGKENNKGDGVAEALKPNGNKQIVGEKTVLINAKSNGDESAIPQKDTRIEENKNGKLIFEVDSNTAALKEETKNTSQLVKEQVSAKIDEMKDIIQNILDKKNELKPEVYSKFTEALNDKMSDFKVFNSISNQYYYLDIPMHIRNDEYQCKLIIKDDRKKGKSVDSKNVKLVANVKTLHMGTVDAYIKVRDNTMDVNLKCEEDWMKVLELGKDKITRLLTDMGYSTYVHVDKKEKEVDLVSCRDFFEDTDLNTINVKV